MRKLRIYNSDSQPIPPHGCCQVTGVDSSGRITVTRPTIASQSPSLLLFNGPGYVKPAAEGQASMAWPITALYDGGVVPAQGDTWGSQASLWTLAKNNAGFTVLGAGYNNRFNVVPTIAGAGMGGAGNSPRDWTYFSGGGASNYNQLLICGQVNATALVTNWSATQNTIHLVPWLNRHPFNQGNSGIVFNCNALGGGMTNQYSVAVYDADYTPGTNPGSGGGADIFFPSNLLAYSGPQTLNTGVNTLAFTGANFTFPGTFNVTDTLLWVAFQCHSTSLPMAQLHGLPQAGAYPLFGNYPSGTWSDSAYWWLTYPFTWNAGTWPGSPLTNVSLVMQNGTGPALGVEVISQTYAY